MIYYLLLMIEENLIFKVRVSILLKEASELTTKVLASRKNK